MYDDLELQRLKAVADAARAERDMMRALPEHTIQELYGLGLPESAMLHLSMALDVLDEGREVPEYEDGPWATEGFHSRSDAPHLWPSEDADWHFLGLDVWLDEVSPPIVVEPLEQGFVVKWRGVELAFTGCVDAAEWLLGWLGFDLDDIAYLDLPSYEHDADELYNILSDCVAGVDYDELVASAVSWNDPEQRKPLEYERALDVVGGAWAFIEEIEAGGFGEDGQCQKLVEAVKKWRGLDSEDPRPFSMGPKASSRVFDQAIEELMERDHANRVDVLDAAQAYVDHNEAAAAKHSGLIEGTDVYNRLRLAVKKWRGIEGGEELHLPTEGTILTDIQQADAMERLDRR